MIHPPLIAVTQLPSGLLPESAVAVVATPEMWRQPVHAQEELLIMNAVHKRQAEFRAGRHSARLALAQFGVHNFPLLSSANRAPIWPKNTLGSITHCSGFCCAIATANPNIAALGIDAEAITPLPPETVSLICSESELRQLRTQGLTQDFWSKVIFSIKESFYKCYSPLTLSFLDFLEAHVTIKETQAKKTASKMIQLGKFEINLLTPSHEKLYNRSKFFGHFIIIEKTVISTTVIHTP